LNPAAFARGCRAIVMGLFLAQSAEPGSGPFGAALYHHVIFKTIAAFATAFEDSMSDLETFDTSNGIKWSVHDRLYGRRDGVSIGVFP
jgi:hypothetical protein